MKILDCTLRDGGYYTNWSFSSELVEIYLKTVSKLPIECIELGYLSNTKDENGPFYHLNANIYQSKFTCLTMKFTTFIPLMHVFSKAFIFQYHVVRGNIKG